MLGEALAFATKACSSVVNGGDDSAHGAVLAQVADKRARINVGNDGNAVVREESGNFFFRAPIAGQFGKLTHHQTFRVRPRGLTIEQVRPVVPNVRVGKDYDLARIRRVGEDFLVAGKRSIENDLAKTFAGGAKTAPPERFFRPLRRESRPFTLHDREIR